LVRRRGNNVTDDENKKLQELWLGAITHNELLVNQIDKQIDKTLVAILKFDLKKFHRKYKDEYAALINNPVDSTDIIKNILTDGKQFDFEDAMVVLENFNFTNNLIPKKRIRELRAEDIGKLVIFDGLVKNSSGVVPKMELVALYCQNCAVTTWVMQESGAEDTIGVECWSCGENRENLVRREDKSVFVNFMKCSVEEDPEGMRGKQPERTSCEIMGPLTTEDKRMGVGDRVTVIGIFRAKLKTKNSLVYQGYIEVLGAVKRGKNYEEFIVSSEDEKKFLEMSKDKDLLMKMTKSVAPNIHGHMIEKSAILLQMIGGNMMAGDRRGDIHILLIGDAGVGKSKMVRNLANIAPHVVKASGAPTTTVGLTACIIKDEDTPGGFILEAGAAVLADGGLLIVDEFDKMDKEVRGAMHEIMEDQKTTISKANINTELNTRCSVLAVMNPKRNRFNTEEVISDQIDLPPTMLSRFDLIFAIRDIVNTEEDLMKCDAMMRAREGVRVDTDYTEEDMTKYIIYARSRAKGMTITDEAKKLLKDRFTKIRTLNEDGTISITLRQMEGMLRLSEACAKLRLSNVVEKQDAEVALVIITHYLDTMCMDPGTKQYNQDMAIGVETRSQRKTRLELKDFVEDNLDMLTENEEHGWIDAKTLEKTFMEQTGASQKDYDKALKTAIENFWLVYRSAQSKLEYKGDKKRRNVLRDDYQKQG
jgi:replicative DNA helicase Mcm